MTAQPTGDEPHDKPMDDAVTAGLSLYVVQNAGGPALREEVPGHGATALTGRRTVPNATHPY
jgi:hypothetical protein